MSRKKELSHMSETELLRNINEKLDNLILAISVSGKTFPEQVSYLNNLGYKPQKISEIIGRSRQSVKDMVKGVKGKKIEVEKDAIVVRLNGLLRLITENSMDKQRYTKAIYYLKSIGLSQMEIAEIFDVNANSIPSYIRQYHQIKNKKKSSKSEPKGSEKIAE